MNFADGIENRILMYSLFLIGMFPIVKSATLASPSLSTADQPAPFLKNRINLNRRFQNKNFVEEIHSYDFIYLSLGLEHSNPS